MADSLVRALFDNAGLDADEVLPEPAFTPPPMSDVATRAHLTALQHMRAARDTLDRLLWAFAAEPNNDAWFDGENLILGGQLAQAGASVDHFRNVRDCAGEA